MLGWRTKPQVSSCFGQNLASHAPITQQSGSHGSVPCLVWHHAAREPRTGCKALTTRRRPNWPPHSIRTGLNSPQTVRKIREQACSCARRAERNPAIPSDPAHHGTGRTPVPTLLRPNRSRDPHNPACTDTRSARESRTHQTEARPGVLAALKQRRPGRSRPPRVSRTSDHRDAPQSRVRSITRRSWRRHAAHG